MPRRRAGGRLRRYRGGQLGSGSDGDHAGQHQGGAAALVDVFGAAPTAFRAGRFGLGPAAVSALLSCGYQVDSSVTPFVSWEATDDGPTFVGAPLAVYRTDPGRDVRVPEPFGPLVEVPITCGYT